MMNFRQAKAKLKKMAKGEYHNLSYEITEYSSGGLVQLCGVYIDGFDHYTGRTWAKAFAKLKEAQIKPRKVTRETIEKIKELEE